MCPIQLSVAWKTSTLQAPPMLPIHGPSVSVLLSQCQGRLLPAPGCSVLPQDSRLSQSIEESSKGKRRVGWEQRQGTLPWHSQRHWSIRCCSSLEGNRYLQSLTNARHHGRDVERSQLKGDRGQALAHPRAGPQGAAASATRCGLTAGERTPFLALMRSGEEER